MSLFKFFESFIQTNPDLSKLRVFEEFKYEDFYDSYRTQEKRFEIESFLDPLFFESIVRCSATLEEYNTLKHKLRKIAQVSQKLFTLSLLNDKLEKEKYSELLKEKIIENERI